MKTLITFILLLSLNAFAQISSDVVACDEFDRADLSGRYTGSIHEQAMEASYAEFSTQASGEIIAKISLPCGTKVNPAQYRVICHRSEFPTLELISRGSSQCTVGNNISLIVIDNKLEIHTRIETPGFRGTYELTRQ